MNNNTAILILSCDKYADVWQTFFLFFQKYWSDCPFPVYLGTNSIKFEGVKQIFSNKISTWSEELEIILKQIPEKYVIIILEDYFIYKPVDTNFLVEIITTMKNIDAAYTKLGAFPAKYNELWPHQLLKENQKLGFIEKGAKYRVCLQTAIWNKNVLLSLLNPDENPWQFEMEASKRSNNFPNPFLCVLATPNIKYVHGPITYYCTALSAGKWMRGAVKLCEKEGISINVDKRPIESLFEEMYRKCYIAMPIGLRKVIDFFKNKLKIK
ncbi:MAG: hypothetical protein JSU07_01610 [Bacteroidetes bacterium]|nr:hypothetical protein [Bacteroidota bacterium]